MGKIIALLIILVSFFSYQYLKKTKAETDYFKSNSKYKEINISLKLNVPLLIAMPITNCPIGTRVKEVLENIYPKYKQNFILLNMPTQIKESAEDAIHYIIEECQTGVCIFEPESKKITSIKIHKMSDEQIRKIFDEYL